MKLLLFVVMCLLATFRSSTAQQKYQVHESTTFIIHGTSTIHDWTATVSEIEGQVVLSDEFTGSALPAVGAQITDTEVILGVKSIDGGKGSTMNNKIYKAFKASQHPQIVFALTRAEVISQEGDSLAIEAAGNLTMAGVSNDIAVALHGKKTDNGHFRFAGVYRLKMSDFEMKPPTAMFGQIKAGNEVTIQFELVVYPA